MIYDEINLINNNYILPYAPIVDDINLCERDEIADPNKLELLINIPSSQWSVFMHNNKYFYSTLIPWDRIYNSYGIEIKSHYFRVLCQDPSIFNIEYDSINVWFHKNHSKLFLISHVVTSHVNNETNYNVNKKYLSKNNRLVSLESFQKNSHEEMKHIIDNKCYTICNGVIFLLALHRLKYIDESITKNNLDSISNYIFKVKLNNADADDDNADDDDDDDSENAMIDEETDDSSNAINDLSTNFSITKYKKFDYIQNVMDDWEELYYAFPLTQLTDYPIHYINSGPDFVDLSIKRIFTYQYDVHIINNYDENKFSFPITSMFPNFDINYWEDYLNNLEHRNHLLEHMDDFMNPNIEIPIINNDYAGILQMFYKNADGYTYWNNNYQNITCKLFSNCKNCYNILKVAFHYYKYESSINKERIITICNNIIEFSFNNLSKKTKSNNIVNVTQLLYVYYIVFKNSNDLYNQPPLEFIKHVLQTCVNKDIFKKYKIRGYISNLTIKNRFELLFRNNITFIQNDVDNIDNIDDIEQYILNTSLYDIIKLNSVHYNYIKQIIMTRLLCLKHFTQIYQIYYVVSDYMRFNKHLLLL